MSKDYQIDSRSYLRRARLRLDDGTPESLIYAALELRFGIEARMQEYLDAQTHMSERQKKGWKIAKLGKTIERAFRLGDRVAQIIVTERETDVVVHKLYYTPVSTSLRKKGQVLGEYLHSMKTFRKSVGPWWKTTRAFLELVYKELELANRGTLLGPPLTNPETGQFHVAVEGVEGDDLAALMRKMVAGKHVVLDIQYLDRFPDSYPSEKE